MKIIGVCCSCLPKSISQKAVKEFLRGAQENGHETELLQISKNLNGCTGCHCLQKGGNILCAEGCAAALF